MGGVCHVFACIVVQSLVGSSFSMVEDESCTSFDVVCFISFASFSSSSLLNALLPFRSKGPSRATCRRCANGAFSMIEI